MTYIPLLLADPSPCLRYLVLRDLLHKQPEDEELQEMAELRVEDALVSELSQLQQPDGSWSPGVLTGSCHRTTFQVTCDVIKRLGYLGFNRHHSIVCKAAAFLFSHQQHDGSFPLPRKDPAVPPGDGDYERIPLQTALPLQALANCGFAEDPRSEKAYQWLLNQRLDDGAWPTGYTRGGELGYRAGYRNIPHSRWGCRSNTTAVLRCLAFHPLRRHNPAARRALDLLLGCETAETHSLGYETARITGAEFTRGTFTYYARLDQGLVLDICWRIGATLEDARVSRLVSYIRKLQGPYGLWEYRQQPQATRWVTFDLLRSFSQLDETGDWNNFEPGTPFRRYPRVKKRF